MHPTVLPSPDEIRAAASRLSGLIIRTPLRRSAGLSDVAGVSVFLKLECEQLSGSFKIRGATNALLLLDPAARARGVVASSAGNHGRGIALAAERLGIAATVFVPSSAPEIKKDGIRAHGATVNDSAQNYDAAEVGARAFATRTGATFISPCTGRDLLAGAGTVALEMLEDAPELSLILTCVGGGGLCGGIGGLLRGAYPSVRQFGAQSELTNAMDLALASGHPTDIPNRPTLADGLAGAVDAQMLAQGQASLDGLVTVEESEIAQAIRWLWEHEGLVVEGSGAVGVAALLSGKLPPLDAPLGITISGANIDPAKHAALREAPGIR